MFSYCFNAPSILKDSKGTSVESALSKIEDASIRRALELDFAWATGVEIEIGTPEYTEYSTIITINTVQKTGESTTVYSTYIKEFVTNEQADGYIPEEPPENVF